ncbi:Zinc finger protein with KRAB and SCAN domains 5 [Bienertia sinuspersici]
MASATIGVSRISLFKAASLDFNGRNWISGRCALAPPSTDTRLVVLKAVAPRTIIACSAVQESSTPAVPAEEKEEKAEKKPAAAKSKTAKAPAKALPQMMEEDIIPALRSILEAQEDIIDLELTFKDNTLEGSFAQGGNPYTFWAFFLDGALTGPKGFSLASYGSEVSTVEPFLIDEKKITPKHVVFWVEKRLAAQGIIPVWEE